MFKNGMMANWFRRWRTDAVFSARESEIRALIRNRAQHNRLLIYKEYTIVSNKPTVVSMLRLSLIAQVLPPLHMPAAGIKLYEDSGALDIVVIHDTGPWRDNDIFEDDTEDRDNNTRLVDALKKMPNNTLVRIYPEDITHHGKIELIRSEVLSPIHVYIKSVGSNMVSVDTLTVTDVLFAVEDGVADIGGNIPNGYRMYALRIRGRILFLQCNEHGAEWTIHPVYVQG